MQGNSNKYIHQLHMEKKIGIDTAGFGTITLLIIVGVVLIATGGSFVAVKQFSQVSPDRAKKSPTPTSSVSVGSTPSTETRPLASVTFSHPYPLSWQDSEITYSITGVSIGSLQIPSAAVPKAYAKPNGDM